MKKLFLFLFLIVNVFVRAQQFSAGDNEFLLNGKTFTVKAGELHYARIPKTYWEHRIQMCKAMGMNTICIYLFWNYHEQQEGHFDFSGDKDVAEFVRLIQKNGMYCILRPGPYVCAEWEMGGLPWWLLKKTDLNVRSKSDSFFMEKTKIYLNEIGKQLSKYQIQNGGPIIMVQVENEYGTWGDDQRYMEMIRDDIREAGFNKVQLVRCDWASNFNKYKLDGVSNALNFGAGANVDNQFKKFKELNPSAPLMCGEYWTGWFDKWGRPHETRNIKSFIGSLEDMMKKKISFSLYMAHGGTSFGQWAGANTPGYMPLTSSYDYNAPIDEAGNPTDKFYAIRELLSDYNPSGEKLPEVPVNPEKTISISAIKFSLSANVFDNLPNPVKSDSVKPMEYFDQGWGSIIYRTEISASTVKRKLTIKDVHDWALIYINGKEIGRIQRGKVENNITIPALKHKSQLDILVEGMGRINYGQGILDRKGITQKVVLSNEGNETELMNWSVYKLPVNYEFQTKAKFRNRKSAGPAWYKSTFLLSKIGYTYFDMSGWGKGMVWINGHNLGRFWNVGPTQTLFVPGCFLNAGKNEIIVLDLDSPENKVITGVVNPVLNVLRKQEQTKVEKKILDLSNQAPVAQGSFNVEPGWKIVTLNKTVEGRFLCVEALSAQNPDDNSTSLAELEVVDEDGKLVSTLHWKVAYVDSEETEKVANGADKLFDQQESVIWQTKIGDKAKHPHRIIIDMDNNIKIKAVRLLPRTDDKYAGTIKDYRIYIKSKPFL
ncbi:MAG: beta-galactosidase [Paludibacter sp.]|nr:beta-galactosidase [Paludibacter sp.]